MKAELLIAGIPANEFVNRRVKIWSSGKSQHPCLGIVTGVNGTKVMVKPVGHKKVEKVEPGTVTPLWSENDDLRQKYNITIESAELANGVVAEIIHPADATTESVGSAAPTTYVEVEPTPAVTPVVEQPEDDFVPPPMVVHAKNNSWIPVYDRYLKALRAEAKDKQMLAELLQVLEEHKQQQTDLVAELALLGVEVQLEQPAPATVEEAEPATESAPEPTPEPPEAKPTSSRPRGLAGRRALEKAYHRWLTQLEKQLFKGTSHVIVVSELGKQWGGFTSNSVWRRLKLLEQTTKLKIEPVEGKQGQYRISVK